MCISAVAGRRRERLRPNFIRTVAGIFTRRIDRIGVSEISLRKWAATTVSCRMIAERVILFTVVLSRVLSLPLSSGFGRDGNTQQAAERGSGQVNRCN